MKFQADWKLAKTTFETTTGKKKPSKTFLGFMSKGSSISSTLKTLDEAKTAGDAKKALAEFNKAYTSYIKVLDGATADPKSVPVADKPDYIKAVKALKASLEKIEKEGEDLSAALANAGKNDKINVEDKRGEVKQEKDQKIFAEALKGYQDTVNVREKVAKELPGVVNALKADVVKLTTMHATALKHKTTAVTMGKAGKVMESMTAIDLVKRYADEAETLMESIEKRYKAAIEGDTLKARSDNTKDRDNLPPGVAKPLETRSKSAFAIIGKMSGELNTALSAARGKVGEIQTLVIEAESAGPVTKSPKEFATRINNVTTEIKKLEKDFSIKGGRVLGSLKVVQEADANKTATKEQKLKVYQLREDQWARYGPEARTVLDRLKSLQVQAKTVPRGVDEAPEVAKALKEAADAASTAIAYVNNVIKEGDATDVEIAKLRQKLG